MATEMFEFDVSLIGGAAGSSWQRVRVPRAGHFEDLHDAIHAAFALDEDRLHLYAFHETRNSPPFATLIDEGCLSASAPDGADVALDGWFSVGGRDRCVYRYNFVAGWTFGVELRAITGG